jgi:NADH:ubiquinone oxidoreductase subunit 3 (subunit A)
MQTLLEEYFPVAMFALVAILFPALAFWVSRFFRPNRYLSQKRMTYECGEQPIGHGQIQFHVQFYLYAIIFVIFDIVTVFLMIWALVFSDLSDTARWYMIIFLGLLLIGVTYALKKEKILWI